VIVSAAMDNSVRFWDAKGGGQTGMIYDPLWGRRDGEVFSVALSPDGKQLALGTLYGRIKLWSVPDLAHRLREPLYRVVRTARRSDHVRLPPRPR